MPAARAIRRITGDQSASASTLLALAGPTPVGEQALALLAEGPPAIYEPLRQKLGEWADTDRRPVQSGASHEIVGRDEHLRDISTRMLALLDHRTLP